MNAKVIITDAGELRIFVERGAGTFEQGRAKIDALIASLRAQGVEFASVGVVEMHLHEGESASVVNQQSARHSH